ncbi:hypothetical protein [Mammaliicoccus sciuri]|uniref:hypothetical protein n=1 Tax=Mammaliicoccus sciuri TaxID=1296 RepID=UPI0019D37FA2|nr:hypothetical protein [Mammaliicoccus sciuri]QSN68462.1 hypothetical protein JTZ62_04720 [Mammaliicoccus sciuri]UIU23203.1 hypothetical protein LLZ87_04730 [Mammaliicoccus sciuri]UIU26108.1 hypothetical protein LLZ92_04730 [Mammaliicoccus sciuri]WQK75236.1 hypothetical protein P3U33_05760 [Mammaliicoccus sciuri]
MTLGTVLTILLAIQLFSFLLGLLFDSQLMFQISWYSLFLMLLMIWGIIGISIG